MKKILKMFFIVISFFTFSLILNAEERMNVTITPINEDLEFIIDDTSSDSSGYVIYRSTDNKTYTKIETVAANVFMDTDFIPNVKYYYKIHSYTVEEGNIIESGDFIVVSYTYKLTTPSITLTNASNNSIKVSYTKVPKAMGYEIYRSSSSNGKYSLLTITSNLNYTNKSLTFNKNYYYKVRAFNLINGKKVYGTYSSVKSLKVVTIAPILKASSTSHNSVKISYAKVTGASGYEISRYDSVSNKWTVVSTTTALSYTNTSLVTGREYQYKARSYKTVSGKKVYGPYSSIVKVTPIPSVPTLTGKSITSDNTKIEWNKVSGATGYLVEIFDNTSFLVKDLETTSISYNFTEMTGMDLSYTYFVTAYKEVSGDKVYGNHSKITIKTTPTEAKITNIKTSINKISFNYDKEYDEVIDGFIIKRSTSLNGTYTEVLKISYTDAQTNNFLFTDTLVSGNKTYYYNVYTYKNNSGEDVLSVAKNVKVNTVPMVANITLTNASYNSMKISWGVIEGASGYEVYRSTSKNGKYTLVKTTTSASFTNTGLSFNKTYYYKVRVYSLVSGKKVYSAYSSIKSKKVVTQSPSVTLTNTNYNTNKVSWKKVTGATGYQVSRYDLSTGKWATIKTITKGSTVTYTDTKLLTGREYKYKVNAYKTSGGKKVYGTASLEKAIIVLPNTPSVTAKSINVSTVKISWGKVTGATGYRVYVYNVTDDTLLHDYFETTSLSYTDTSVSLNKTYRYEVEAYRTVSGVKHYSKPSITNIKVTPTMATISRPFSSLTINSFDYGTENNTAVDGFIIKRSTSLNGTYTQIADKTYSDASNDGFIYYDMGLSPNKTYYYEIYTYVVLGGDKILSVPKKTSLKTDLETPIYNLTQFSVRDIFIEFPLPATYDIDGYEIYRATSKTGKYTKVKTTGISSESWINGGLGTGSTYYYKIRGFKTINGVKYYSSYSSIKSVKLSMKAVDKYPLNLYLNDGSTFKITNVSLSKKSYSGDYVTYTLTVKANVNSKKAQTGYTYLDFYNILYLLPGYGLDDYSNEYKQLIFKLSKGKYTKTYTFTIKLHKTSIYYAFDIY